MYYGNPGFESAGGLYEASIKSRENVARQNVKSKKCQCFFRLLANRLDELFRSYRGRPQFADDDPCRDI